MTSQFPIETDFYRVLSEKTPLLDVRAPIEYSAGAIPNSINLPLLNDEERHLVGMCYKQKGQDAAISLGYELVDEEKKQHRLRQWQAFLINHPNAMLYCFRGGLRSRLTQTMLATEMGIVVPRLAGGYKAMRRYLMTRLTMDAQQAHFIVLGGRTGSGKTELLQSHTRMLDLEQIANHKGSAFGQAVDDQPSQIDIEHRIATQLLNLQSTELLEPILVEDESAKIGARRVPASLWERMQSAPLIILDAPIEERIDRVFNEYITQKQQVLMQRYSDKTVVFQILSDALTQSLSQIRRRLGDERYRQCQRLATEGIHDLFENRGRDKINLLILKLLTEYYDPMYDYQLSKKTNRIQFCGTSTAIHDWLRQTSG